MRKCKNGVKSEVDCIKIIDVTVEYKNHRGNKIAVNNVSFNIDAREFICILGPSGCGKSTLLNALAGILKIDKGDFFYDEQRITHLAPFFRNISYVFQDHSLYPNLTVYNNLKFPLDSLNISKAEKKLRIQKIAKITKIDELLKRRPNQLSGGEQQRVAIAKAIVKEPLLLLLDEPFSSLDAKLKEHFREWIKDVHKQLNFTTIFVTHDHKEALSIADRIIVMDRGAIQQIGTPTEVYCNPANLFVARFIGDTAINILDGDIKEGYVQYKGIKLISTSSELSSQIVIAVRAEDISIDNSGYIQGEITKIVFLGNNYLLYVKFVDVEICLQVMKNNGYKEGDVIKFSFDNAFFFNKETERRLFL